MKLEGFNHSKRNIPMVFINCKRDSNYELQPVNKKLNLRFDILKVLSESYNNMCGSQYLNINRIPNELIKWIETY